MHLMKTSIDRLTLLGSINEQEIENLPYNPMVKMQRTAQYPYRYQYHMIDGSVMQIAEKGAPVAEIRFEFNPNNWDSPYNKDSHIMSILRMIRNPRISRIDVAMDISGYDFGKAVVTDRKARKEVIYRGRDKAIETYYFGTRRSEEMIRIYNKGREQGQKKQYSDTDWWRAEAQIMGDQADRWTEINPFQDLFVSTQGESHEYDIGVQSMLFYLRAFPEKINELSVNSRRKYKELLLATAVHTEISLAELYEQNKNDLIGEVEMWKSLTAQLTTNWDNTLTDEQEQAIQLSKTDLTQFTTKNQGRYPYDIMQRDAI